MGIRDMWIRRGWWGLRWGGEESGEAGGVGAWGERGERVLAAALSAQAFPGHQVAITVPT